MDIAVVTLLIIGGAFSLMGLITLIVFVSVDFGVFILIPLLFLIIGLIMLASVFGYMSKKRAVKAKGIRYTGKIYGYIENRSVMVNGQFTVNVKVRYFDSSHVVREAIIPTSFAKGSNQYPVGMTIDIFEYNGQYSWDKASIRSQTIWGEEELMDNKPLEPDKLALVAAQCPNCGAFFEAYKDYSSRCPYCGSAVNN